MLNLKSCLKSKLGLDKQKQNKFKLKLAKKIIIVLIFAIIFQFFSFSTPVSAQDSVIAEPRQVQLSNGARLSELEQELIQQNLELVERPPLIEDLEFIDLGVKVVTAYSSDVYQTDGSPCITANGFNICEHGIEDTIATNFLAFGTKVRVPELFGDKIFYVRDRMNPKYPDRVDVWMINYIDAKQFGVKYAKVEIIVE